MAVSMTGFGRGISQFEAGEITVEIRSVNHRFFEFTAKTPKGMGFLDERLKKLVGGQITRGKVDAFVSLNQSSMQPAAPVFRKETAESYLTALRKAGKELGLKNDLKLSSLLELPDLFVPERKELNEDALWEAVQSAAAEAMEQLMTMRRTEGEKMEADLLSRLETVEQASYEVEKLSGGSVSRYQERLRAKLAEVLADQDIDENRIVTEAAIFADRIATDEETVRLRSHITQFRSILKEEGPVGRKLDFLVQELNREVNTIGSKCSELTITNLVVSEKAEIEKIREQVQNLE